jgi:Family of unknown function (DUF6931)/Inner membrane component of T3SS, cytoplasmic domain
VQATLQLLNGPETGRTIHLKNGQVARFGRTEWSDFAFPYDRQLADVHFSIETTDDAVCLLDLSQGQGVQVDGVPATSCQLRPGQRIEAGSIVFAVDTEMPFETSRAGPVATTLRPETTAPPPDLAKKVCESVELSEAGGLLLDDSVEVLPFLDRLTSENLLLDALRVLAAWLSKRKAVWWGADCVESACGDRLQSQKDLLVLIRAWAREPSEENRRAALEAAETADTKLPACWLARAAGWSGGSLSPPGLPIVPPDEHLTARALTGTLLLAAPFAFPAKCAANYRKFIELGKQLGQSVFDWEKP